MKKTVDEIIFSLGCCMEEECEECKFFLLPFCKDRLMEAAKGALEDQKEELGGLVVKKSKGRKIFTPPSLNDVYEYAAERGRLDLAQKFYDYYTASNWLDGTGRKVVSWKGKFVYWENNNPKPPEDGFMDEVFEAALRLEKRKKQENEIKEPQKPHFDIDEYYEGKLAIIKGLAKEAGISDESHD